MKNVLTEASSMGGYGLVALGLPTLIQGVSQIVDFDEGQQVAEIAGQAAERLSTGDWMSALMVTIFGGLAIWKREKK